MSVEELSLNNDGKKERDIESNNYEIYEKITYTDDKANNTEEQNVKKKEFNGVRLGDKTEDLVKGNDIFGFFGGDNKRTLWVQFQGYTNSNAGGGFNYDPNTRNSFIKFVFTIVFIMLCITAIFTAIVYMTEDLRKFFLANNMFITIGGMLVMLALSYAMTCSECSRKPPCNYFCLLIAVVAMSLVCAAITSRYKTHLIVFALIATLVTVFVCILIACSNFDFTKFYIYIIVLAVASFVLSMIISVAMFAMGIRIPALQLVMLIIGTLINVVILIMELQMIIGGKSIEIGESDYALAAFLLYTSVVDIFLRCLQMSGLVEELAS